MRKQHHVSAVLVQQFELFDLKRGAFGPEGHTTVLGVLYSRFKCDKIEERAGKFG